MIPRAARTGHHAVQGLNAVDHFAGIMLLDSLPNQGHHGCWN